MYSGKNKITKVLFTTLLLILGGCSGLSIKQLPSNNHNDRIRYLIIHQTTINYKESIEALTEPDRVSSHYIIPEKNDPTYPSSQLEIIQLVDEKNRAWHAGTSFWQGKNGLNDQSIGIELVNLATCKDVQEEQAEEEIQNADQNSVQEESKPLLLDNYGLNIDADANKFCFYPEFDDQQIGLLIKLSKDIVARYPEISPTRIIGHADITPDRRVDPGPRFPWKQLYDQGIGAWYDDETVLKYWRNFKVELPSVSIIQKALADYGYGLMETGIVDSQTINTLTVFQMHFRPWQVNGKITVETAATLFALLEKYFPKKLILLMERINRESSSQKQDMLVSQAQLQADFSQQSKSKTEQFKAYKGRGKIKITGHGAKSADIYINGKKFKSLTKLVSGKSFQLNIAKLTINGFNHLKVTNIRPKDSSISIQIPFPKLLKARSETHGFSKTKLTKIDQLINKEIRQGFPGAALVIVKNGEIIKQQSYGYAKRFNQKGESINKPIKIKSKTLFDLGSNTKLFATNYALMKLISENKINLNAPVMRYLPEYVGAGRESRLVKDLVAHTAGYASKFNFFIKDNQLDEVFYSQNRTKTKRLLIQKVPFEIGRRVKTMTSDLDYMLLGSIVERVTGESLDSYLENSIYKPLGLKNTLFNPLKKLIKKRQIAATALQGNTQGGEISFENIREKVIHGEVLDSNAFYSMEGVSGHAGLFSSAKEIAVLASIMLNQGGYGDIKLFDKQTISQFIQLAYLNNKSDLAWEITPYASPYAYGHSDKTGSLILIDPFHDLIIVLLTNKKHSPIDNAPNGKVFKSELFQTGRYQAIASLIYEAFIQ